MKISLLNAGKRFNREWIFRGATLEFSSSSAYAITGPNGSGKSTVLKIMAGVDKDIEGEVTAMPNLNIGYLPQEPQLDAGQTVRQRVRCPPERLPAAR